MNVKIFTGLLILLGTPLLFQISILEYIKLKTFDTFVVTPEPSGNFVILDITEEDVDAAGGYPFPREELAKIHLDLLRNGALGVGWVLAFPHEDRFGGDYFFKEALGYSPSVIALFENNNGVYPVTHGTVTIGQDVGGYMAGGTVKNITGLNALEGIASAPVDIDNLVRRIPLLYKSPDGWIASFGTQVLKALTGSDTYIIKTNANGIQEITVKGIPPVKTDSLGRKWISWVVPRETSLAEMEVDGKFVFVGVTAKGVMPQIATPVGLLEPHKIQAALAESILIENSPYIPDYSIAVEILILIISLLLVWVALSNLGITTGALCFGTIMLSTAFGGHYLIQQGLLIDVTWSLISQFIMATIAFYLRFREQFKLRLQIKKQFEHYLDPRQVKQLQKNPDLLKLGGETKYCTYLFTDLRGFTALSEKLGPQEVTQIMNKTLTAQVKVIQKHGGMIDKFIGDACMAIFGAPLPLEDHEKKAVTAAVEIQEAIKELNKTLATPVAIGVGLQTGYAVVGNMGSETRFDYSCIGDPVNTAARLESATKEAGVDILIGEETAKNCTYVLKSLESIKVKGKKEALKIYTWDSN